MNHSDVADYPKSMGGRVLNNSTSFLHLGHPKREEKTSLSFLKFLASSHHIPDFYFLSIYIHILQHMEAPRLGLKLELQLRACTTATAMRNLSHFCNLHHSSLATSDP